MLSIGQIGVNGVFGLQIHLFEQCGIVSFPISPPAIELFWHLIKIKLTKSKPTIVEVIKFHPANFLKLKNKLLI